MNISSEKLIAKLIAIETDPGTAPDEREVIRDERLRVQAALGRYAAKKSGYDNTTNTSGETVRQVSYGHVASVMDEAKRVAKLWGHVIA